MLRNFTQHCAWSVISSIFCVCDVPHIALNIILFLGLRRGIYRILFIMSCIWIKLYIYTILHIMLYIQCTQGIGDSIYYWRTRIFCCRRFEYMGKYNNMNYWFQSNCDEPIYTYTYMYLLQRIYTHVWCVREKKKKDYITTTYLYV